MDRRLLLWYFSNRSSFQIAIYAQPTVMEIKKPDAQETSTGLRDVDAIHYGFLSTPILFSSSELRLDRSKSELARARNRSSSTETASANISDSFLSILFNAFGEKKLQVSDRSVIESFFEKEIQAAKQK